MIFVYMSVLYTVLFAVIVCVYSCVNYEPCFVMNNMYVL